jgi:putative DNA-invertase from lambdoid prophage Rac
LHLHLIDLGGDVTNGLSRAFFTIAAAFAEAERDRICERIKDVKADQRQRGRFLGGHAPFGYRAAGGRLVEDEAEQAAIATMRELRRAGASLRAIATEVQQRHGFNVSHVAVKRILADQAA